MNQIILKLEGEKVTSYTLWQQISIDNKNNFNVIKKINGKTYGMIGTQTGLTNFDEVHNEVIQTIQRSYPETKRGTIKYCAVEVKK